MLGEGEEGDEERIDVEEDIISTMYQLYCHCV